MVYYQDTLRFDSIVVIESLRGGDLKTGEWLYDRVLAPLPRRTPPLHTEFKRVNTHEELLGTLDDLRDRLFAHGHIPIIHVEAHGSSTGLELTSGETVEWEELRERLTELNRMCRVNLLLVMAMCAGWHLARLITPMNHAPVWGVVGPLEDVAAGDLREAMESFYRALLNGEGGYHAVSSMNEHVPYERWQYLLESAEIMFCRVFNYYANNLASEDQLQARENEIVAEIVRRRGGDLEAGIDARERARRMLREHAEMFAYYRRSFLWLDLYPENESRFKLAYNDCATISAPAA